MLSHDLNLNLLRVFESVYRTKSMTEAAKELHLTQSGVSQHITALEEVLKVKLFDRVKQRLIPTDSGNILYQQSHASLNEIENVIWQLKGEERSLRGVVNIGMPIEFGNNIVMPIIADFVKKNPKVSFKFNLGFASTMNDLLVKGELDFAVVDDYHMDRSISTQKVYDEIHELCMSEEMLREFGQPKNSLKYYESLSYVEYQPGEPLLRRWFEHHIEKPRLELNVKSYIMDVQGIARLIENSVGAGILPGHLVEKLIADGHKLYVLKGSGKPLKNSISLAKLTDRTLSRAARTSFDHLLQALTAH